MQPTILINSHQNQIEKYPFEQTEELIENDMFIYPRAIANDIYIYVYVRVYMYISSDLYKNHIWLYK